MSSVAAVVFNDCDDYITEDILRVFLKLTTFEKIFFVSRHKKTINIENIQTIVTDYPFGGETIERVIERVSGCAYIMIVDTPSGLDILPRELDSFLQYAHEKEGSLYYCDYYFKDRTPSSVRQTIDYQVGSIRDDFSFGPIQLFSTEKIKNSFSRFGGLKPSKWAGLYELRLRVSLEAKVVRIPFPLCCHERYEKKSLFGYVDRKNLQYQKEMEIAASDHLKKIIAYCNHDYLDTPSEDRKYPVEASVVIPVKNREKTISDAVMSALNQKTDFDFNVIVVQNHSNDKTGDIVDNVSKKNPKVIHLVPNHLDLKIGGCWNEAVMSPHCGRYVCQLDSDDLYSSDKTLQRVINLFREGIYGIVVGSYRTVNFELQNIPPGIVDHREWTDDNGRNNLLRVHGIGAPRAFPSNLLRMFPFPDESYGEDYAVCLRISRDYRVGRIYDPIYLCRRWEDNTDSDISFEQSNRNDFFKDLLRSKEIYERKNRNSANRA